MPVYDGSMSTQQRDKSRQRLQRTLRSLPSEPSKPLSEVPPNTRKPQVREDHAIVGRPAHPVQPDPEPVQDVQYQCTSCDMMVGPSDSYCPFCGAIFADGSESEEGAPSEEHRQTTANDEHASKPTRFDVLSMVKPRVKSRELLYAEALHGFAGAARLLEEIELLITEVSAIGCETRRARRLMSDAWEACREGDWPLVSELARQTEDMVAPSIPDLVRSELAKARNMVVEAKMKGVETSRYIVMMKAAMSALHREDIDDALRATKQLMDLLREDASLRTRTASPT